MDIQDKKYGLLTSIAMVVGVVIGSGVFFKADDVLVLTKGNLTMALVAWIIGAFSMIFGALVFSKFAERIQKANGIVDYSEEAYGKKFGYIIGWFNGLCYYSPLSAILAYISSYYTLILFDVKNPGNQPVTWILAFLYLLVIYIINYLSPIIAGKFQVATTIIKLIPLLLIASVGIIYGLINGVMIDNLITISPLGNKSKGSLSSAIVATAFAYEGWIVATTINNEIKDSKKNLPKALIIGTLIIFIVYMTYFMGITGVLDSETIINEGNNSVMIASNKLFGPLATVLLTVFVIISCLGTLNGLVISCIRTPYSLAIRNQGPFPKLLSKVYTKSNLPTFTVIYAFLLSLGYLIIWYGSINNWFGQYVAIDEIPIVLIYGVYIILYIWYMRYFTDLNKFSRFVLPTLAIIGSLFILYGGITNPSIGIYLLISFCIILLGLPFYRNEVNG